MRRHPPFLLLVLALVAALVAALVGALVGGVGPANADPLPGVAGTYTAVSPTRLLDTRSGVGGATPAAHGTVHLQVLGVGPIPSGGVSAVVLNITVVAPTAGGFVTAWADGASQPVVSNLNFRAGQTVPNLVVAPVGSNGKVALFNGSTGSTPLLADVAGYYTAGTPTAGGAFAPVAPTRLLDTRTHTGGSTPAAHGTVHLQVTGRGGVPDGAAAVVLNLTAVAPSASGFVTAYADTGSRPGASNLNFVPGRTVPNLAVVPLGTDGKLALYNGSSGATPLLADVAGYILPGAAAAQGAYTALTPARLLDTRAGTGGTTPSSQGTVHLKVTGRGGVPSTNVEAVVLNVTAAGAAAGGFVTAYADGATRPAASNLNFAKGQTVPNLVVAPVGTNGMVALYNGSPGRTPLVADVAGYFLAGPAGSIAGHVTRASDGAALGNVGVDVFDLNGNPIADGATAANGAYSIGGLGASAAGYVVCFDAGNVTGGPYADECHADRPWDGFSAPPTGVLPVPVSAGTSTTVDAALGSAQGLGGTITSGGLPLAGVVVRAFDAGGDQAGIATTGPAGTYSITLDPGDYTVCLDAAQATGGPSATGYLSECFPEVPWTGTGLPDGTTPVTVTPGELHGGVDAVLAAAGALGGRVVADVGGALLGGVTVRAYDAAGDLAGTAATAAGAYTIRGLPAGTYSVCFDGASATGGLSLGGYVAECTDGVAVTAGSLTSADAGLANGGGLGGTVTAAGGTGVAGVAVTAYDGNGVLAAEVRTDAAGTYRIGGLPAGAYTVCFDASGASGAPATGYVDQCYGRVLWDPLRGVPALDALAVQVTTALTLLHIDLPLPTGARLTGTVTETGTGGKLGDVDVVLLVGGTVVLRATTGADGTYALPGVPAGSYTVCFDATFASGGTSPTGTYASECYSERAWDADPGNVPAGVTAVTLTAGVTRSALNAALSDA